MYLNLVDSLPRKIESLKEDQIDLDMPFIWAVRCAIRDCRKKKITDEIIPLTKECESLRQET